MLRNTADTYGSLTKFLHWTISILIIGMLIFGFILTDMQDSPTTSALIGLHKSIGMSILILMVFRVFWRFANPQPALPITVPLWEQMAARAVHFCLYFVAIAMPFTGWAMSSFGGHPVKFWGWINIALPVTTNKAVGKQFFTAHSVIAWIIIGLLVLHVGAALKHHFFEKNNVLRRMLPGYKPTKLFSE